ncbi:hypothetical protein D3C73_808630 [compost metagenome]
MPNRLLCSIQGFKDLEWQTHLENCPVAKAGNRYNHVSPEKKDIRSFSEFQVTEKNEKCRLQEKQKCHFGQVAGKSHKSNG